MPYTAWKSPKSHVFPFCEIQAKVRRGLKREGLDAAQGEADIRRTGSRG
jgi:hypothetical protein